MYNSPTNKKNHIFIYLQDTHLVQLRFGIRFPRHKQILPSQPRMVHLESEGHSPSLVQASNRFLPELSRKATALDYNFYLASASIVLKHLCKRSNVGLSSLKFFFQFSQCLEINTSKVFFIIVEIVEFAKLSLNIACYLGED